MYPIATMCRVLEVSTSGYYAWCKRSLPRRAQRDAELTAQIRQVHAESDAFTGGRAYTRSCATRAWPWRRSESGD